MRLTITLLLTAAAWAQAPVPPPAPTPPPLAQLARMINDYGNTFRYAAENQKVPPPAPGEDRVVFMGDSITDNWGRGNGQYGKFFPGKPYFNRGISGQVTPQMLLRFYQDVVVLKPKVVVILAGTNDIGGNIGPMPLEATETYLMAMSDLARANNIKVVLAALTPVCDYHVTEGRTPQTQSRPPQKILALNQWIQEYAAKNHFVYLDYFSATVDDKGFFKAEITNDGLHPNAAGYEIMGPLAEKAIAQALVK
ncbi:MAG TPA: GDSL-type esterase/lipase family protein [Bryobacteraceae bacterium]|nr:GDSL-type esterase/lipase family protein [Bryobacteraceae bacterium]